jgi:tetratricopeptide (TPR) repeat protein
MRWLLLLLGSAALLAGPAAAQPDRLTRRFETATEAYRQGQYTRAVEMYEGLLDTGYGSAALYYNLGNAYVRVDRLGPAIRYYEKARRLRPDDPRIRHNLEQARRRAGVYPERLRRRPRGLVGIVAGGSPFAMFVGGLLLLIGGLAVGVAWSRPGRPTAWRRPLVWGPVGAGLLLAVAAFGVSYAQTLDRRAVVVTAQARLHRTPSADAPADTTLPEGALLEVGPRADRWRAVRLADGTTGWLPLRALGDV